MTRLHRLALLAVLALTGTAPAADKYGPFWRFRQDARPAKVDATRTVVGLGDTGDPIGVQVHLWGDVGNVEKGHKYQLMYQLRVQTKKGEVGPLLGDSSRPNGVAFTVVSGTADDKWNGLDASVDITREKLAGMTGLPKHTAWGEPLLLRVEPQLFDVTTGKFVTDGKSNCLFLAVTVTTGKVASVTPLHKWLSGSCGKIAQEALDNLAKLDVYDAGENKLQDFYFDVLLARVTVQRSDVPAVIRTIPPPLLSSEAGQYLWAYLKRIADGEKGENGREFSDDDRAAAKAKLAEK